MAPKAPTVKRYKATREGYRGGKKYEASVVTYGKTRQQTIDELDSMMRREGDLYIGVKSGQPRLSITRMQRVEQEFVVTRRDVIKGYTRIVKGKKQRVRGYTRTYGYYRIPEHEYIYDRVEGWVPS